MEISINKYSVFSPNLIELIRTMIKKIRGVKIKFIGLRKKTNEMRKKIKQNVCKESSRCGMEKKKNFSYRNRGLGKLLENP